MSSNEFKNYYATLGVKRTSNVNEIKKRFRQLALKYHPDRNQGDKVAEAKFKEFSEAYDVLSDEEKRAKYDRFSQYVQQNNMGNYSRTSRNGRSVNDNAKVEFNSADFSKYGNFEEFIDELLGRFSTSVDTSNTQNSSSSTSRKNTSQDFNKTQQSTISVDSEASITLTYAVAFHGTTKRINLGNETVEVRIPAGAKPGSQIRLAGKGKPNLSSPQRGDLYLQIKLDPHPFFSFDEDNLFCEVPITPDEAVLGSSISIPTPDGRISIKVPAGISSGQVLRLRGKGWSSPQGNRTDQLVKIVVATPQMISSQEKECYEKIRDLRRENPRDSLQGISL